jgi:hypothetical protein
MAVEADSPLVRGFFRNHLIAPLSAAAISALPLGQTAFAELLIKVDKSAQRTAVSVNGEQLYNCRTGGWPMERTCDRWPCVPISVARPLARLAAAPESWHTEKAPSTRCRKAWRDCSGCNLST